LTTGTLESNAADTATLAKIALFFMIFTSFRFVCLVERMSSYRTKRDLPLARVQTGFKAAIIQVVRAGSR